MLRGIGRLRAKASGSFSPLTLSPVAWYDPSDLSSMSQDSGGVTPAAVDSPVGRILDKSGSGNHAIQATADARPILRQSGALYYLEFDGANDRLAAGSVPSSVARSAFLAGRASGDLFWGVNNGQKVYAYERWFYFPTQTNMSAVGANASDGVPGFVVTDASLNTTYFNGAVVATGDPSDTVGSGWNIGGNGSDFASGRFYGGVLCNLAISAADIPQLTAYLAAKAGVSV